MVCGFIFPCWSPGVVQSVLLPLCSSWFICTHECGTCGSASHHLVGSASCSLPASCSLACPIPPATALLSPLCLAACLHPSYRSGCMFLLNFLVFRLPYSSIFHQFWLFFVFKLLLSFFWLCEEAQCIYLHLHLGRKSPVYSLYHW